MNSQKAYHAMATEALNKWSRSVNNVSSIHPVSNTQSTSPQGSANAVPNTESQQTQLMEKKKEKARKLFNLYFTDDVLEDISDFLIADNFRGAWQALEDFYLPQTEDFVLSLDGFLYSYMIKKNQSFRNYVWVLETIFEACDLVLHRVHDVQRKYKILRHGLSEDDRYKYKIQCMETNPAMLVDYETFVKNEIRLSSRLLAARSTAATFNSLISTNNSGGNNRTNNSTKAIHNVTTPDKRYDNKCNNFIRAAEKEKTTGGGDTSKPWKPKPGHYKKDYRHYRDRYKDKGSKSPVTASVTQIQAEYKQQSDKKVKINNVATEIVSQPTPQSTSALDSWDRSTLSEGYSGSEYSDDDEDFDINMVKAVASRKRGANEGESDDDSLHSIAEDEFVPHSSEHLGHTTAIHGQANDNDCNNHSSQESLSAMTPQEFHSPYASDIDDSEEIIYDEGTDHSSIRDDESTSLQQLAHDNNVDNSGQDPAARASDRSDDGSHPSRASLISSPSVGSRDHLELPEHLTDSSNDDPLAVQQSVITDTVLPIRVVDITYRRDRNTGNYDSVDYYHTIDHQFLKMTTFRDQGLCFLDYYTAATHGTGPPEYKLYQTIAVSEWFINPTTLREQRMNLLFGFDDYHQFPVGPACSPAIVTHGTFFQTFRRWSYVRYHLGDYRIYPPRSDRPYSELQDFLAAANTAIEAHQPKDNEFKVCNTFELFEGYSITSPEFNNSVSLYRTNRIWVLSQDLYYFDRLFDHLSIFDYTPQALYGVPHFAFKILYNLGLLLARVHPLFRPDPFRPEVHISYAKSWKFSDIEHAISCIGNNQRLYLDVHDLVSHLPTIVASIPERPSSTAFQNHSMMMLKHVSLVIWSSCNKPLKIFQRTLSGTTRTLRVLRPRMPLPLTMSMMKLFLQTSTTWLQSTLSIVVVLVNHHFVAMLLISVHTTSSETLVPPHTFSRSFQLMLLTVVLSSMTFYLEVHASIKKNVAMSAMWVPVVVC